MIKFATTMFGIELLLDDAIERMVTKKVQLSYSIR